MTDSGAMPVYTARDITDLLNAVPTLFGFRPAESLVAVATYGRRRRLGFRLRVDLPPLEQDDVLARLVARHMSINRADGVIVLALSADVARASQVVQAVGAAVSRDAELVVAAWANGTRYWCDDEGFPADGLAYSLSEHHPAIVHAVAAGQQVMPNRASVARRFDPVNEPHRTQLQQGLRSVMDELLHESVGESDGITIQRGIDETSQLLSLAGGGTLLTDVEVLRFAAWMLRTPVRDALWIQIDRASAQPILEALVALVPRVPDPAEPSVLSLAAFAAWLSGDGAQALMATERALTADPEYPMALLVQAMVEAGMPPEAWDKVGALQSA